MSLPDIPASQIGNVQYVATLEGIGEGYNAFQASVIGLVNYGFTTGIDEEGNAIFDYSSFDEGTADAAAAAICDAIAEQVASALGVTTAAVQATISVERQWALQAVVVAQSSQVIGTTTDFMTYPAS